MERRVLFGRHDGKDDRANPTHRSLQLRPTFFARHFLSVFLFNQTAVTINSVSLTIIFASSVIVADGGTVISIPQAINLVKAPIFSITQTIIDRTSPIMSGPDSIIHTQEAVISVVETIIPATHTIISTFPTSFFAAEIIISAAEKDRRSDAVGPPARRN